MASSDALTSRNVLEQDKIPEDLPLKEENGEKNEEKVSCVKHEDLVQEAIERFSQQEKEDLWRLGLKNKNCLSIADSSEATQNDLKKREKSIAKVQKIVSRLRRFTESDLDSLIGDLQKLDVSMHLSEVADALCESPMKQKDVSAMVDICSLFLEHYGLEFSNVLESSVERVFRSTDISNVALAAKRRSLLKFLVELILVEVIPRVTLFTTLIKEICETSLPNAVPSNAVTSGSGANASETKRIIPPAHQVQKNLVFHNVGTIEFLARKFNTALLGESGTRQKLLDSALGRTYTRQCTFPVAVMATLRTQLISFYQGTCQTAIARTYSSLLEQINANQARRINKGLVDAESEARYTSSLTSYTRLRSSLESLSDYLGLDLFTFSETVDDATKGEKDETGHLRFLPSAIQKGNSSCGLLQSNGVGLADNVHDIWEDETEKDFYTNLLNLADAVPACLLGVKDSGTQAYCNPVHSSTEPETINSGAPTNEGNVNAPINTGNHDLNKANVTGGAGSTGTLGDSGHGIVSAWEAKQEHKFLVLDQFVANLCRATLASEVDNLAIKFFYEQLSVGKAVRKRLTTLLMGTHRNDLHVLPSIARFLATIGPFCKDILQTLAEAVPKKFKELLILKDPLKFASLVKTARFLGELCKFRLIPSGVILDGMNELLLDFSQNNIEVACNFVQSCGRFLLAEPVVKTRLKNIAEKLMKMKNNRNLPIHLELMVEDSYFQLFPSERHTTPPKQLSPCRQFIHWLLYEKLHLDETSETKDVDDKKGSNLITVVTSLRRLNWDDPQIPYWIRKAIVESTCHISYNCVGNIAHLLCRLVPGYPEFVISCIDDLFEAVQLSLEANDYKEAPQRIRIMKLIGELFVFRLIDTSVIFQTLYQHIQFSGSSSYGSHTLDTLMRLASITENTHLLSGFPKTTQETTKSPREASEVFAKEALKDETSLKPLRNSNNSELPHLLTAPNIVSVSVYPLVDPLAPEDPSDDFFRLKLICVLLDVCGQYFSKGPSREKMDRFLYCFHRYMWFKRPLPLLMYYDVLETLERLRPKRNWNMSLEEVDIALRDMLHHEASCLESHSNQHQGEPESCQDGSSDTASIHDGSVVEGNLDEVSEGNVDTNTLSISEEQASDELGETLEESPDKVSGHFSASELGMDDEDNVDDDDEDNAQETPAGKTEEELQAMMFDLELSRTIMQSLQEAKPTFGVLGQRGRIDALLEDIRLPPLPKIEQTTDLPQDHFRVRLVTRKNNHPNKVLVKLVDIPKQSRLCQAVFTRETKDAQEHERLKRFVMDSVARHQKQEQFDRQNAMRNQMFYTSPYHKNTKTTYPVSRRRVPNHVLHSTHSFS